MAFSNSTSTATLVLAFIGICIAVLLVLRHYLQLRSAPLYLLTPIFLALAIPCSIILILPVDLASNAVTDEDGSARGIWLPYASMLVMWRIAYWLTFILTWVILPLIGDYADSGYQDPRKRAMDSIRSNLRYQLIILTISVAVLVYYILYAGFDGRSLKGTVIAMAYAWGLILSIFLLGHGLVALPRQLYRNAFPRNRLRRLQTQAPSLHERKDNAFQELAAIQSQVSQLYVRKTSIAKDYREWIEELAASAGSLDPRTARPAETRIPSVVTEKYLAELSRKLKRAQHSRARFVEEWIRLVQMSTKYQAVIDGASSQELEPRARDSSYVLLTPFIRYHIEASILPALRLSLSALLAFASVSIVWSEVFKAVPALSVVGRSCVHHPSATARGKIGLGGQIMAAAWLCYMCIAALTSIREVKIWGNRRLVRRNTYPESATWYSTQVAKLLVPLSYNFLTLFPKGIYKDTAFHNFLGKLINLTNVGSGFSTFFPVFILFPICATTFGLYGRLQRVAGFGVLDEDNEEIISNSFSGGWREGRALLERERIDNATIDNTGGLHLNSRGDSSMGRDQQIAYSDQEDDNAGARRPRNPMVTDEPERARGQHGRGAEIDTEGGGFLDDLVHRVRNTFDTVEGPSLMTNIWKPKWLPRASQQI